MGLRSETRVSAVAVAAALVPFAVVALVGSCAPLTTSRKAGTSRRLSAGFCPQWSPTGDSILVRRPAPEYGCAGAIWVLDACTGGARQVRLPRVVQAEERVGWLPNSRQLVQVTRHNEAIEFTVQGRVVRKHRLPPILSSVYSPSPDGESLAYVPCDPSITPLAYVVSSKTTQFLAANSKRLIALHAAPEHY